LVYELDLMMKKAFKADLVRLIFLPYKKEKRGIFMEGHFNRRELYQIDLANSLAEKILDNRGTS